MSSTSNNRFAVRYSSADSSRLRPGNGCTRRLAARVSHTAPGSVTDANSQSHAPSGNLATTSVATCNARRVLPTPPTPVSVTSGASRTSSASDATWVHRAPRTFPHHGWVEANGLTVAAPGLPEAEVTPDGVIAITLLRTFGWLARFQLGSRPIPAGPALPTPDGQLPGGISADLSLRVDVSERVLLADELGLRAVPAGDAPILEPGVSLLTLAPETLVLSSLKPGDDGACLLRVLNPTDETANVVVSLGVPVASVRSLRLDESPDGGDVDLDGSTIRFTVGPHALRTIAFVPVSAGL